MKTDTQKLEERIRGLEEELAYSEEVRGFLGEEILLLKNAETIEDAEVFYEKLVRGVTSELMDSEKERERLSEENKALKNKIVYMENVIEGLRSIRDGLTECLAKMTSEFKRM